MPPSWAAAAGLGATSAGPGAPGPLCSQFAFHGDNGSPGGSERGGRTPYESAYTIGDLAPRALTGAAIPSGAAVTVVPNLPANDRRRVISIGYAIVSPSGRVTLTSRRSASYSLPPRSFASGSWKVLVVIVERDGTEWMVTTPSATFTSV